MQLEQIFSKIAQATPGAYNQILDSNAILDVELYNIKVTELITLLPQALQGSEN